MPAGGDGTQVTAGALQDADVGRVVPGGRQVKCETIQGHWDKGLRTLAESPEPFSVCYEASCGYGYLHDALAPVAHRVTVAHPGQLRLIFRSKRKNDRIDARRLGHVTKEGPATLRKLLVEAAWQAIRRDASLGARFERLCQDQPKRRKIAVVGGARYLACVMVAMLRSGETYRAAA